MKKYSLGLYEKSMPNSIPIIEKLRITKAAGYDYLELSIDESDEKLARLDWGDREIATITAAMHKTGISIKSICLSGHRKYPLGHMDPLVTQRALEIMEKAIILAENLGARIIQLAGYDVYYEKSCERTREVFKTNLKKSVAMAAQHGVMLAFETMETDFINTVEKAMYWVNEINSPYLQIYPDIGNITNAAVAKGVDPVDDLKTGKGHIGALHLKETVPGVFREVLLGTGHVDFGKIITTAKEMGVGMFVIEFWYVGNNDWKKVLVDNRIFIEDFM